MNKAQRLVVAGAVAPVIRRDADRLRRRVVNVFNQQTGETVAQVDGVVAVRGILATANIEFEVQPDVRPKEIICEECGRVFQNYRHGLNARHCVACRTQDCAGCGKPLSKFCPSGRCKPCLDESRTKPRLRCVDCEAELSMNCHRKRRTARGLPARCKPCASRASAQARAESLKARLGQLSASEKEARMSAARKGYAKRTPEERSSASKKASAVRLSRKTASSPTGEA